MSAVLIAAAAMFATADASTCDVNRASLDCTSPPLTTSIDTQFDDWLAAGWPQTETYPSCPTHQPYDAPQDAWHFTCAQSGMVRAVLVPECPAHLVVLEDTCNGASDCVAAGVSPDRMVQRATFFCDAGLDYYLVVEPKPHGGGAPPFATGALALVEDCARPEDWAYTLTTTCR